MRIRTRAVRAAHSSCPAGRLALLTWTALLISVALPCAAQFPMRSTVLKDATLLVGDGTTIDGGSIVITGEKITAVGKNAKGGMLSKSISVSGKYVTPGLIDAWSTLGLRSVDAGRSPAARAADAFDRFDHDVLEAALQQGVTLAYVPARAASGTGGLGAIVRLLPDGALEDVLVNGEAAICAGFLGGDPRQGALQRVKVAVDFRKQWLEARQYRKSLEVYEEDLKEYEERVKKRVEENKDGKKDDKKDESKEEKPSDDKDKEPPSPPPTPTPRPDRPRPPRPRPNQPPRGGGERRPARPETPADAAKKTDKKDDLNKPAEPQKDRGKETLLKALDGKLAVRIEAHRPEDILNALDIAKEFNLALVIEGGVGAHLVASRLAQAHVPVVLSPAPPAMTLDLGLDRYAAPDAAAKLARAGVKVSFGSGPAGAETASSRHLALLAAAAAGAGMDGDQALRAITGDAAELLGIAGEYGTIASGRFADLVVWSDHPLSPGAKVERVYVRGKEVYRADAAKGDSQGDDKSGDKESGDREEMPGAAKDAR